MFIINSLFYGDWAPFIVMTIKILIEEISGYKNYVLIKISGELDYTVVNNNIITREIMPCIETGEKNIIMDLQDLSYIDSTGILNILYCYLKLQKAKRNMRFIRVDNKIRELFMAIGLTKMIPLCNNISEAIKDIEKGKQRWSTCICRKCPINK